MMGWMAPLRHLSAKLLSNRISSEWEPSMGEVTTIGLDLAKHVFQVHGVDAEGGTVLRKQLRRAQVLAFFSRLPPCLTPSSLEKIEAVLRDHGVIVFATPTAGMRLATDVAAQRVIRDRT